MIVMGHLEGETLKQVIQVGAVRDRRPKATAPEGSDTTFASVMLIPQSGRSIPVLFFGLIWPSNAGILRCAQNDRRWVFLYE